MVDNKFNNNRNKFRKVYAYGGKPPPNMQSYIDRFTGETRTTDFNQIFRDHDYYLIGVMQSASTLFDIAEYLEEEYVITSSGDSFAVTFSPAFSSTPIVTLEIPTGSAIGWVNPYILSISTTGFTFGLSAPSTGSIIYKAINLTGMGTYPAQVTRAPRFPSLTALASAGTLNITPTLTGITMSFNAFTPALAPSEFSFSTVDNGNNQSDTYVEESAVSSNAVTAELSADLSGTVDYIALQ